MPSFYDVNCFSDEIIFQTSVAMTDHCLDAKKLSFSSSVDCETTISSGLDCRRNHIMQGVNL